MKKLHYLTFLLVIVGALNWGLVGLFDGFDLVAAIFGDMSGTSRVIYALVGAAAIYEIVMHKGNCKICGMEKSEEK